MKPGPSKDFSIKLLSMLAQLGVEPLRLLRTLQGIPGFLCDLRTFRRHYKGSLLLMPCLQDRFEEGGATKSEYFWQDLLVARWIHEANPQKHVDVGSRVDGFVAHVASFRELEVLDVRQISANIPGIRFRQVDLMSPESIRSLTTEEGGGYCDSLSCLHVLEHFGLGRYGDSVDSEGYRQGFANLAALLRPRGTLYLATPIGNQRVEFNANWVFAPRTILDLAAIHGLRIKRLLTFHCDHGLVDIQLESLQMEIEKLAQFHYRLGIMQFVKDT